MSDNTKIQAEILQALLNTSNISDEAYEYLKQHLLGGGSGGGGVVENMTLHDDDTSSAYFVSERDFDDIAADFKAGKQVLLYFDRFSFDAITQGPLKPLYTPIIAFISNWEWSEEQQQEIYVDYLNCLQHGYGSNVVPAMPYGNFDTYGGKKDENGKLRFVIHSD